MASGLNGDHQFSVANHPGVIMLKKDNQTAPKVYLSSKNTGQVIFLFYSFFVVNIDKFEHCYKIHINFYAPICSTNDST